MYTYKQEVKGNVRHTIIRKAVELLTVKRAEACCVRNSYVRDLYEYFSCLSETHEQEEAAKIDTSYIREWERMHANLTGFKRPDELSVCYLSGPEPENDFREFVAMGVLPQNIWAFECEKGIYHQALKSFDGGTYMQPKIIKTSIERFFENSPKKFDIVYVDACASLISDNHALRCVSSLFQNHRLNSPGVLITNFAMWDGSSISESNQYIDIISRYCLIQKNRDAFLINDNGTYFFNQIDETKKYVSEHLEEAYGEFITPMICNAASITIPSLRFCNSNYLQTISSTKPVLGKHYSISEVNAIQDNNLYKYIATNEFLGHEGANYPGIERIKKLAVELSGVGYHFDLLSSIRKLHELRNEAKCILPDLEEVIRFFEGGKLYQFLDKPNGVLFFDSVINQLSYPMHYVSEKSTRLTYIAKEKRMFTDLLLFDECRYIYDWIPAVHQITKSFSNPSWQYIFRFGLDGLIKQRINYNNEFFFRGSVISKTVPGFEAHTFPDRIRIN